MKNQFNNQDDVYRELGAGNFNDDQPSPALTNLTYREIIENKFKIDDDDDLMPDNDSMSDDFSPEALINENKDELPEIKPLNGKTFNINGKTVNN